MKRISKWRVVAISVLLALTGGCGENREGPSLLVVEVEGNAQDLSDVSRLEVGVDNPAYLSDVVYPPNYSSPRFSALRFPEWAILMFGGGQDRHGVTAHVAGFNQNPDGSGMLVAMAKSGPVDIPRGGAVVVPVTLERAPGGSPVKHHGLLSVGLQPDAIEASLGSWPTSQKGDSSSGCEQFAEGDPHVVAIKNMIVSKGLDGSLSVVTDDCSLVFDPVGSTAKLRPGQTCTVPDEGTGDPDAVVFLFGRMRTFFRKDCAWDKMHQTFTDTCTTHSLLDLSLATRSPVDIRGRDGWCISTTRATFDRVLP